MLPEGKNDMLVLSVLVERCFLGRSVDLLSIYYIYIIYYLCILYNNNIYIYILLSIYYGDNEL